MKKIFSLLLCIVLSTCLFANGSHEDEADLQISQTDAGAIWPQKTTTIIVPAQAGSSLDLNARVMAEYLQRTTGNAFVIQNDVTGNGTVAYENVRNAAKNGTTLLYTQNLFLQYHGGVYSQNPWDAFDVVGIGQNLSEMYILVAKNGRKEFSNWNELVAYAKANPGKLVAGIQNGGMAHLLTVLLEKDAGIQFKLVEAGSSADKISGILGGYIDVAFVATATGADYVKSGDLLAFMTTTSKRSAYNDTWPTSSELGYKDIVNLAATGIFVPKGTDPKIIAAISNAISGMASDTKVIESDTKLHSIYTHYSPEEATKLLQDYDIALTAAYKMIGR
ncbi:MAG: tripartite tricarboxylate transporter substrate binding protein [Spirochaetia bacterium]|jgi:tripartite-type tricarboxylate transporter receptor subunit TctC|nr:tripartite tricarboxylate transporter substrate binding protein [Spirochaetia bacterium]